MCDRVMFADGIRFMIAAPLSGSGKTSLTLGLLGALTNKGANVHPFKVGPDYIDAGYHSRVCGKPSINLDSFLLGRDAVKDIFQEYFERFEKEKLNEKLKYYRYRKDRYKGVEIAVIEGVMGLYDGIGSTFEHSSYDISTIIEAPVVLVINAKGMAATAAAIVEGCKRLGPADIRAVIFNNVSSSRVYKLLKKAVESRTEIPCVGYMPYNEFAGIPVRHLGLIPHDEIGQIDMKLKMLENLVCEYVNTDMLLDVVKGRGRPAGASADATASVPADATAISPADSITNASLGASAYATANAPDDLSFGATNKPRCRIAVARDNAFNFYYEDNLVQLRKAGAELIFFSPISDETLPDCDGAYIGGGFPEEFAKKLTENISMRKSVQKASKNGLPIYAEGGGYMYLMNKLVIAEVAYDMCGVFKGSAVVSKKLNPRFGYIREWLLQDTIIGKAGTVLNVHEFHRSYLEDADEDAYTGTKISTGETWIGGNAENRTFGTFAHAYFRGNIHIIASFISECANHAEDRLLYSNSKSIIKSVI